MRENSWLSYTDEDDKNVEVLAGEYKEFLSKCKTERECTEYFTKEAEACGYQDLNKLIAQGTCLKAGDKVYGVGMGKTIALFQIGKQPLTEGMNILCAHIDSPRLDLKQNPLYEDTELSFMDTHYYGGIKKYQWVALPLALHGVVAKKDGTVISVNVGEDPADPVVYVTDLLIHLAGKQMEKKGSVVVEGENLDILVGSRPLAGEEKDAVKANILRILKEKYQIEEEDFLSAEIEVVPAGPARDCGLDRSMIAGYGHDDRVCAYPSFAAMMEAGHVDRTSCCLLVDKEEIGSTGASGMTSRFFENAVAEYVLLNDGVEYNDIVLRRTLANSKMLSSDVSAGFDPMYEDVYEKKNAAFLARGPVFNKYTGSGGKSGSNDANPEYVAQLRQIMEEANVNFQTAELGRVDVGGGGTIAYLMSVYGMEVIDSGVAVLGMHAPWETTSKADIYEAVRCYEAFLKAAF